MCQSKSGQIKLRLLRFGQCSVRAVAATVRDDLPLLHQVGTDLQVCPDSGQGLSGTDREVCPHVPALCSQHQIHNPAAADVRPVAATMRDDLPLLHQVGTDLQVCPDSGQGLSGTDLEVCPHLPSLLTQHQIHDPAAADVRPVAATMRNDLLLLAAGVHERIGQDRHPLEGLIVVDRPGEADNVGRSPTRVEGHGAEGVAEDVANKLRTVFGRKTCVTTVQRPFRIGLLRSGELVRYESAYHRTDDHSSMRLLVLPDLVDRQDPRPAFVFGWNAIPSANRSRPRSVVGSDGNDPRGRAQGNRRLHTSNGPHSGFDYCCNLSITQPKIASIPFDCDPFILCHLPPLSSSEPRPRSHRPGL